MSYPTTPTRPGLERQAGHPAVVTVADGPGPVQWTGRHAEDLRALLTEHGAVMVRGLGLQDPAEVSAVFSRLAPHGLMPDREAFAVRQDYSDRVYSSVPWPANQPMCMHHELSYALEFPGTLLLACRQAPGSGGATGVADAHAVLEALPEDLVHRFETEGWLLTRSFNEDIGASYHEAFGVTDRAAVERYCLLNRIEADWQPDGELRTRQRRPAVVRHPVTGERCWFNQVAFLNEWTIAPEVREYLVDVYGPDGLPFNTRYGNGEPIGEDVINLLNEVYEDHTVRVPWQAGDLLLVDNVRMAHSREAYQGPREILVGMADPRHISHLMTYLQDGVR